MSHRSDIKFTAAHHALLFSCIAKAVIGSIGPEKGEPLIRKAVRKYGEQRGKRMALRAEQYGHKPTMDNYLAFGEWTVPKGSMDFTFVEKNPHARLHIFKCPWHDVWKEHDLLDYGKLFCKEIDAALVRGFNPELEIVINSTRTNGGQLCDFVFKDAGLSLFTALGLVFKKKIRPGKNAVMPWDYHSGHLFKTMGEVLEQDLGEESGQLMKAGLDDFSHRFSPSYVEVINSFVGTDFEKLPDKPLPRCIRYPKSRTGSIRKNPLICSNYQDK